MTMVDTPMVIVGCFMGLVLMAVLSLILARGDKALPLSPALGRSPGPGRYAVASSAGLDLQAIHEVSPSNPINLLMAGLGGMLAAVLGAVAWGLLTGGPGYQTNWAALLVGAVVGISVRKVGQGHGFIFRFIGGIFALLACVAANLLAIYFYIARAESLPLVFLFLNLTFADIADLIAISFDPVDNFFYLVASVVGFGLSTVPEFDEQPVAAIYRARVKFVLALLIGLLAIGVISIWALPSN